MEGEPMADEMLLWTEAPESEVEDRTGGCISKDCAIELVGE